MRMNTNRYCLGVTLTLFGGAGLAEITTSNHGCFWLCVTVFAVGFALCITEFLGK